MREPNCPKIQVENTTGATLGIQFDHLDVTGEDWIETFKTIMIFLGFAQETIKELFNMETENNGECKNSSDTPIEG